MQLGIRALAIGTDMKSALGSSSPLRDTADELDEIVRRLCYGPDD